MDWLYIVLGIIFVVCLIAIIKFVKTILKVIIATFSLCIIMIMIAGVIIFADIQSFNSQYPTKQSLYIMEYPMGNVAAGFYGVLGADANKIHPISRDQIILYQPKFKNNDLGAIIGNNYKLFIIKLASFDSLETIRIGEDISITKEQLLSLISSEKPIDDFVVIMMGKDSSENQRNAYKDALLSNLKISTDAEFKGLLFLNAVGNISKNNGLFYLLTEFKKGNIIIYPQTILFDFISVMPVEWFEKLIL